MSSRKKAQEAQNNRHKDFPFVTSAPFCGQDLFIVSVTWDSDSLCALSDLL